MENEEEKTELGCLCFDGIESGLFHGDSAAEEIFFSLPELEEQEMAWGLGDFG